MGIIKLYYYLLQLFPFHRKLQTVVALGVTEQKIDLLNLYLLRKLKRETRVFKKVGVKVTTSRWRSSECYAMALFSSRRSSGKLLRLCQTPKFMQPMHGKIPYMFACWPIPVLHLLLNSSLALHNKTGLQWGLQCTNESRIY